jgi:hypothetical protein
MTAEVVRLSQVKMHEMESELEFIAKLGNWSTKAGGEPRFPSRLRLLIGYRDGCLKRTVWKQRGGVQLDRVKILMAVERAIADETIHAA